jgi:tRNA(Ile)-lysidine synthase
MDLVSSACAKVFDGIADSGRIFVGFSGGMDSTVLLHALAQRPADHARIIAVHVNHGLAGASSDWLEHCERTAAAFGVGFTAAELDLNDGGSMEARARTGRYRIFDELLGPGDVLALAHHLGDRDESFLLHLLQGRGVFSMPRRRSLGQGVLLRPLLDLPRSALEVYAGTHDLTWVEDPMNLDPAMDRNFLRQSVLPILSERFQGLSERLDRVIRHTTDTERALVETLGLGRHPLPLAVFNGLSRGAQASVLRHWLIERNAAAGISDSAIGDFLVQLDADNDRQPELSTPAGQLRRYRRELYLVEPLPELQPVYPLPAPGALELPHGRLELASPGDGQAALALAVRGPLTVTFLQELDSGTALRWKGHDHRVREVLREAGIPPWRRDSHPLIMDSEGLAAVAGVAVRDETDGEGGSNLGVFRLTWNESPELE